jgi:hypothetical protein
MDWITKVRAAGDFAAVPANIDFASSGALADLVDGFDLAGDEQLASEVYWRVMQQCRRPGAARVTALDALIANHYAHYAYGEAGQPPTGGEAAPHDRLARELRAALLRLTSKQRAGILAAFIEPSGALADGEACLSRS